MRVRQLPAVSDCSVVSRLFCSRRNAKDFKGSEGGQAIKEGPGRMCKVSWILTGWLAGWLAGWLTHGPIDCCRTAGVLTNRSIEQLLEWPAPHSFVIPNVRDAVRNSPQSHHHTNAQTDYRPSWKCCKNQKQRQKFAPKCSVTQYL